MLRCMFCGVPESSWFADIYAVAEHALSPYCWNKIRSNRVRGVEANFLAPTRTNFDAVVRTWKGCKKAFSLADRRRSKQFEDEEFRFGKVLLALRPWVAFGQLKKKILQ